MVAMKRGKPTYVILLFVALALLGACAGAKSTDAEEFDVALYTPQYASGFEIRGAEGRESSIITIHKPWQGADSVSTHLFIARGGEIAPEGFGGQTLCGEAKRIVTLSSTHIAMLDAIRQTDRVVGVSGLHFIANPEIRARKNEIGDIGYAGNTDYELLVALRPDIVLLYGVDSSNAMEAKLRELNIPYIYLGDYLEQSPLGKAEWMVVIGELTGHRAEAEEVFAPIPKRYEALKMRVVASSQMGPGVMLNIPYADSWFMPSVQTYMARLVKDAGGNYLYATDSGNASLPIDMETAYSLTDRADVWLNTGTLTSLGELARVCPKFTAAKPFRTGRVYNNNARLTTGGGNDFYESGIVNPDIVLRDLIKIFHPDIVIEEPLVYYRKLD